MMPIFACLYIVTLINTPALCAEEMGITIKVSPNVIQDIAIAKGDWVTVHTDIAYSSVAVASITLNGLNVDFTKSDDCGNLVAKFRITELKTVLNPGENLLRLEGLTKGGILFSGTDTILYIVERGKG